MEPDLNIEYLPTDTLIPYANNARTHTDFQVNQITQSIRHFRFINPVIIDEKNMIVAGHARIMAAKEIDLAFVPCIRVDHLTEDEKRAYILADNKLAENAGWDEGLLRIELEHLTQIDVGVDVDLTGFSISEIDLILHPVEDGDFDEESLSPIEAIPKKPVTQPGDTWELNGHRLTCGDCRNPEFVDQLMTGKQASMVFTDPPYNVKIDGNVCGKGKIQHNEFSMASGEMTPDQFTVFLQDSLSQLIRVSKDGSLHYVCMDWRHLSELLAASHETYDSMINLCVWNKTNAGMGSLYRSQHELIAIFKKGKASHINNVELGKNGRHRTNVWTYAGINSFGKDRDKELAMHPTVKPVKMVADAIMDVTAQSDIVLDGFLGSGTTLLAAEKTKRICYGIEIDPGYVDVALKRWIDLTGKQPVHAATGKTFEELSAVEV